LGNLALYAQIFDSFLNLRLELLLECLALGLQLLLDIVVGLGLELGMNFSHDVITLLLLVQSILILVLHHQQFLLQLVLLSLLLADSDLGALNLDINLLLFGQATDLQVTAFTTGQEMTRDVLEQWIRVRNILCVRVFAELIAVG